MFCEVCRYFYEPQLAQAHKTIHTHDDNRDDRRHVEMKVARSSPQHSSTPRVRHLPDPWLECFNPDRLTLRP